MTARFKPYHIIVLAALVVYWFGASLNASADSLAYALNAFTGRDMLYPHHLLYVPLGYCVTHLFSAFDPLTVLQHFNAVLAAGVLWLFGAIYNRRFGKGFETFMATTFCACCFGFARFATDNEVYILFVLLALMAINFVQLFLLNNRLRYAVLAAVALLLCCLSHQLGILVWIPTFVLLCFPRFRRVLPAFLVISLLIPMTYWAVCYFATGEGSLAALTGFVLHDYSCGVAEGPIVRQILLFTPISLVRTFIQVHASTLVLLTTRLVPVLLTLGVLWLVGFVLLFWGNKVLAHKPLKPVRRHVNDKPFLYYCLTVLLMVFGFAAFSNGNAEFMTLVPFLLLLVVGGFAEASLLIGSVAVLILGWNIAFGLQPQRNPDLNGNASLAQFVHDHPQYQYDLADPVPVINYYNYHFYPDRFENATADTLITDRYSDRRFTRHALVHAGDDCAATPDSLFFEHTYFTETLRLYNLR